jgi:hypothetical protein
MACRLHMKEREKEAEPRVTKGNGGRVNPQEKQRLKTPHARSTVRHKKCRRFATSRIAAAPILLTEKGSQR